MGYVFVTCQDVNNANLRIRDHPEAIFKILAVEKVKIRVFSILASIWHRFTIFSPNHTCLSMMNLGSWLKLAYSSPEVSKSKMAASHAR